MRMNFQSSLAVEAETLLERQQVSPPEPGLLHPRPIKDPDYDAIRNKVMSRFSKTLAYLAK